MAFKSPNVFIAYVAMPQAAASPRPALSTPPGGGAEVFLHLLRPARGRHR